VSKQGYHKGSVLITCPSCRNRHVISDNLNIFGDRKITVEDLLREKGQLVKRGTLGEEGDIEFWEDTSTDTADMGDASAVSTLEEAARSLRNTQDPSSRAADPIPSASALPRHTDSRSSSYGITHQSPLPSTRRQFHTKRFKPPSTLLRRGVGPVNRIKEVEAETGNDAPLNSEVHTPHDSQTDFLLELQASHNRSEPAKYNVNRAIASLRAAMREDINADSDSILMPIVREVRKPARKAPQDVPSVAKAERTTYESSPLRSQAHFARFSSNSSDTAISPKPSWAPKAKMGLGGKRDRVLVLEEERKHKKRLQEEVAALGTGPPIAMGKGRYHSESTRSRRKPLGFTRVRHVEQSERQVMDEPRARKVIGDIRYTGPRFVVSDHEISIAVQLRPGIVSKRRPIVVEESPAEVPEAPRRPGCFRPSFLPITPDSFPARI
jgi:hypothetical protein